ncbi:hypothetical protein MKX57_08840 [Lysinibacillus sp. FSL M8-0216]|uniref:hypothetical protein n=1 Tax=Lysinibacillus TaxID=400634 RepID=UPI0008813373|nr:hypothetical protein [Lysinibacillus fusiformis]MCG7434803.1 hypothetical protein [Lysinibacillus fusiformis]SCX46565.1 hypothetical protein SAMN02787108_01261 [Lysinibacillus fusiformis]SDB15606.1 hypothetical protein SAMN02787070_01013 [Lysinibacillus fusiformis]SFI02632.1 hypothetical protein SAMN02787080_01262 [Lysinibacillus fusiformis]SFS49342.1 hypothetical protein SAMN02787099_00740 [Lysinibacillus fusiformis]
MDTHEEGAGGEAKMRESQRVTDTHKEGGGEAKIRESQRVTDRGKEVTDRKGKVTDTPAHFLLLVHPFSSPLQPTNKSDINTMLFYILEIPTRQIKILGI